MPGRGARKSDDLRPPRHVDGAAQGPRDDGPNQAGCIEHGLDVSGRATREVMVGERSLGRSVVIHRHTLLAKLVVGCIDAGREHAPEDGLQGERVQRSHGDGHAEGSPAWL